MANLKSTLEALSQQFARNVLAALKQASIEEIMGVNASAAPSAPRKSAAAPSRAKAAPAAKKAGAAGKRRGRLPRRSPAALARAVDDIEQLLRKHPSGLRAERIRAELDLEAREMPRPLAEGLKTGRLSKTGDKRATTYFAGKAAAGANAASSKPASGKKPAAGKARAKRGRRRK